MGVSATFASHGHLNYQRSPKIKVALPFRALKMAVASAYELGGWVGAPIKYYCLAQIMGGRQNAP